MCVCERERDRDRDRQTNRERERGEAGTVCVCVCVRERERERRRGLCVCVCGCVCVHACVPSLNLLVRVCCRRALVITQVMWAVSVTVNGSFKARGVSAEDLRGNQR